MDYSIPDYIYKRYLEQEGVSFDRVVQEEQVGFVEEESLKCSICGKDGFLFSGRDYKMYATHSCCYDCFLRFLE